MHFSINHSAVPIISGWEDSIITNKNHQNDIIFNIVHLQRIERGSSMSTKQLNGFYKKWGAVLNLKVVNVFSAVHLCS